MRRSCISALIPPNIEKLHAFIQESGYQFQGKHHEIYLSDPRKCQQEKMKTIIRQPVSGNKKKTNEIGFILQDKTYFIGLSNNLNKDFSVHVRKV